MLGKCHSSHNLNYMLSLLIGTLIREGHSESERAGVESTRLVQFSTEFVLICERKDRKELRKLGNLL